MDKMNEFNFRAPTRQSPVAIILLVWKYFINIIRQLWPALIAVFIGRRSSNFTDIIVISVIALAVISLTFAIIYYLRFAFRIEENELIIHKGVIRKSKLSIPLERIQTLNFEQGIIHQVFDVIKIEVDTAGSSKNEFTFNALERNKAEALRQLVLDIKSDIVPSGNFETEKPIPEKTLKKIYTLSLDELIRIGLTQNHLRTLVLLFFLCSWGIGELDRAGLNVDFISEENAKAVLQSGIIILIVLSVSLLLIIIAGTIIRTILRYYNFSMFRVKKGFKISAGLINKKEYAALDHKVQQIKWTNNPLKRILKINRLFLKQASSVEVSSKKSITIPGIKREGISHILEYILDRPLNIEAKDHNMVHRAYLYRNALYFAILPWPLIAWITYYLTDRMEAWLILLIIPYALISIYVAYKKWRFSIDERILYTHHGIFENKNNVLEQFKIQSVKVKQTPYQRRKELATIKVFTAAGALIIPYIPLSLAAELKNYFLYNVESSTKKWY